MRKLLLHFSAAVFLTLGQFSGATASGAYAKETPAALTEFFENFDGLGTACFASWMGCIY
jgi:hypothetical protein